MDKKMPVVQRVVRGVLGTLNIMMGLFLMPFLLLYGIVTFITGLLYFIFGVTVIFGKRLRKLLFYGIIPFTALHSLVVIMLSRDQDSSNYFRMTLFNALGWILPVLFVGVLDVYFLTRSKVKD